MPTRTLPPRITLKWWGYFALTLLFLTPLTSARLVTAQTDQQPYLQAFDLITETEGWILINGHLFWSKTGGQSWSNITPPNLVPFSITEAYFLNPSNGWLILNRMGEQGMLLYALARTQNGGQSWQIEELALFEPGEVAAQAETLRLYFLDSNTGWLVVKQATSPNFSIGALFKTEDGGQSWTRLALPIGEPVYFVTEEYGWTAGGVTGTELYRTTDGGRSWQVVDLSQTAYSHIYRPKFDDAQHGVLPILQADDQTTTLAFHSTQDGGESWQPAGEVVLSQQVGSQIPLSGISSQFWVAAGSEHLLAITLNDAHIANVASRNPIPNLSALDLATERAGWAMQIVYNCQSSTQGIPQACQPITTLLGTNDGGQSWQPVALPQVEASSPLFSFGDSSPKPPALSQDEMINPAVVGSKTTIFYGQGFDKCEVATLTPLQNWITTSPYRVVNLYIGGSSRGCSNSALNAAYITQLDQLGWRFIPTWVGPQAACTSFKTQMSYDPVTAYNEGVAEANAAVAVAVTLGLTESDGSGTVIYYDLESYDTTDIACRNAAAAFIDGWTAQLQAAGNTAGVYGSGCSSAMTDFAGLTAVPDVVWLAYWLHPFQYRADATVWDVLCVSNSLWANNQRLRQYSGGHNESWGGVTLTIDSNALQGVVADLSPLPPTITYLPVISKE